MSAKIIGKITTYHGQEHRYMDGYKVRIVAILKNAAKIDEYDIISNDVDLERSGGVTAFDRVDVRPWVEQEGRFSFVSSDPMATELACFNFLVKCN